MDLMDVFVKIGADTSDLESGVSKSKGLISGIGSAVAGATAAATAAVGAFAASSVNVGMSFDSSMSQVAATMGTTVDQIGELRDFALDMGSKTAFSATQAAEALNYMALAGYDANTSMSMLPNVLNLAAAGNMELATASDMVTDAQSALGLSLEETTELVDMMAKTSSKSNTSVQQLGDAILTIGGTAKTLAGGTTELNTALGILADNGIKGSEGGTKLRNVILSLSAPTDKAAKMLDQLGVSTVDAQGNMRPLEDIMGELSQSLEGMGTADKADIINTIFNKQDIAAVNALLDTSKSRWNELSSAIDDSKGAAEQMAETQLDNLEGDITLFKSALEGAQITVSDGLTPSLREFVQFGTEGLTKITDGFKEGGLSGAMDAFGTVLSDGLNMIISNLPKFIDAGMKLLGALGKGLLDNIPTIIDAAVQIIGQLVEGIISALPALVEGALQIVLALATGLAEALPNLIPAIVDVVINIANYLIDNVDLLIEAAIQLIMGLAEGLIKALPKLIEAAPKIIKSLVAAIVRNLPMLIEAAIQLIGALTQALIENAPLLLSAAVQIVMALVSGIIEALPSLLMVGVQLVTELVASIIESVPKFLEAGVKLIGALIEGIVNMFGSIVKAAIDLVTQFIKGITDSGKRIIEAGKETIDTFAKGIKQKIEDAKQWGKDLISNFIGGIKAKWDSLKNTVSNVAGTIRSYLHFTEPDVGPLSDFHTYAPDMMELFAKGIKDNERMLRGTVASAFDFTDLIGNTPSGTGSGLSGETNIYMNIYGAVGQSVEELADIVSERINDATGRRMVAMGVTG